MLLNRKPIAKFQNSPLQNLLLEIALLMGADIKWATGGVAAASAGPAGGPVLGSGSEQDTPVLNIQAVHHAEWRLR